MLIKKNGRIVTHQSAPEAGVVCCGIYRDSWAPEFYQHILTDPSCEQITDCTSYLSLILYRTSHCPRVKTAFMESGIKQRLLVTNPTVLQWLLVNSVVSA